ncbi:hypothetical protein K461DRAFT_293687 [Myriangium duriaei CBS 260.36]|uniref:Uncharacterized protein n=1 Tax=Myriangium duriaei CBS 260.36 TaxID=1168546 RepID=A0A9P4J6Q8_9PEZI|nr:hypothetical protein K461DRAFT_293687 [Myriangium duriaei CBS 260.36]
MSVAGSTKTATPTKPAAPKAPSVAPSSAAAKEDPAEAIKKLEIKTKAVNANNVARVANSQLVSADDKLHPLVSIKTGKAIDKFPSTPKDVSKLSVTVVDAILNTLEADRTGKEDDKRERLRIQIGLKPNPA